MARLPICMTVVGKRTRYEAHATIPTDGTTVDFELRPVAVELSIRHSPACDVDHRTDRPHE